MWFKLGKWYHIVVAPNGEIYLDGRLTMKANEYVLTIVQVAAPVTAFAFGNKPMGIFLTIWLVFFGIAELVSKAVTGGTLSQNVWKMSMWKRIVLSAIMIAGMIALGYHFIFGG